MLKNAQVVESDAINYSVEKGFTVDALSCEGCKVCVEFCPENAIDFRDTINGQWFISNTRFGTLVHAKLGIAQENSGKLVSLIRKEAKRIAQKQNSEFIIADGSPGIGCPVIASITGADLIVLVTEPTISAQHDLDRVIELIEHFKIPAIVCINKFDINLKITKEIETNARYKCIKVAAKIPYDNIVTRAQIAGKSIIEYTNNSISENVKTLWQSVMDVLNGKETN